jgi:hypothetical protein
MWVVASGALPPMVCAVTIQAVEGRSMHVLAVPRAARRGDEPTQQLTDDDAAWPGQTATR